MQTLKRATKNVSTRINKDEERIQRFCNYYVRSAMPKLPSLSFKVNLLNFDNIFLRCRKRSLTFLNSIVARINLFVIKGLC